GQALMKFYCDNCGAKYSISDEKVRGKILKVRCKKCSYIITVREPRAPAQAKSAASSEAVGPPSIPWHYSINGQSYGPYEQNELVEMYASGRVGDASYVWNETFTRWKPVYEVPEFLDALEQSRKVRPRVETIGVGVTGQIEAVQPAQREREPLEDGEGVVAGAVPGGFGARTPDALDQTLSDRLGKLRERLKGGEEAQPEPQNLFALSEDEGRSDEEPSTVGLGEVGSSSVEAEFDLPPIATREGTVESEGEFRGVHSGQFPSLTRDMVRRDEDDSEVFASAGLFDNIDALPANETSSEFAPSASLLIVLDSIQKQGRSRRVALLAFAAVLLVGLGVTAGWLGYQASQRRAADLANKPAVVQDDGPDELVFHTYSQEELAQFLELEEEVLTPEELEASAADFRAERKAERAGKGSKDSKRDAPLLALKRPIRSTDGTSLDEALRNAKDSEDAGASSEGEEAAAEAVKLGRATDAGPKTVTRPKASSRGRASKGPKLRGLGTPSKKSTGAIIKPADTVARKPTLEDTGLSKEDARAGFKKIRKSLGYCHQRHISRGLPVEPKISMTVEIQTSGSVTSMKIEPRMMQNTELDRCMQSHMQRWRFASFRGKPLKIKHTYVLQ
ncbi:MAG: GYF domain-containing protein, partial [Myxococcota bacterium]